MHFLDYILRKEPKKNEEDSYSIKHHSEVATLANPLDLFRCHI